MKQDNLDTLFKNLTNEFDLLEPQENHKERFLLKLKQNKDAKTAFKWKPLLSIAASILLLISLFVFTGKPEIENDLASVSPEMKQTQDYFTLTINEELKKLNAERNPETQHLIDDAMELITQLETDYLNLTLDLNESGNDQRVIYAMINNFQSRIDILNTVLEQIESIKELKNNTDENSITL